MSKLMAGWCRIAVLLLLVSLLSACSSFNRKWNRMATSATAKEDIQGRWEGSWLSDKNGHNGSLRCIVTKNEDNRYEFFYKAVYAKILKFSYKVQMDVEKQEGVFRLQGSEKLLGTLYHYEGSIEGDKFAANYRCRYDHGTFKMQRVP